MHAYATQGRASVPRVTLYVKDADVPTWDRAKALVEGDDENSLSAFVTDALQAHVERRERTAQAAKGLAERLDDVELSGVSWENQERSRKLRFKGVLVIDGVTSWYVTKGKQVVCEIHNPVGANTIRVFEDFDAVKTACFEEDFLAEEGTLETLADSLGEDYFEQID